MAKNIALSVISSVILIAIFIGLLNIGTSLFLEPPNYEDYCPFVETEAECLAENGTWTDTESPRGYCQLPQSCSDGYDEQMKNYNQLRFYIFAGIGFVLLILGLIIPVNFIQWTALGSGGIAVIEAIVFNFANKMLVFFSLLAIFVIFGIFAWRKLRK